MGAAATVAIKEDTAIYMNDTAAMEVKDTSNFEKTAAVDLKNTATDYLKMHAAMITTNNNIEIQEQGLMLYIDSARTGNCLQQDTIVRPVLVTPPSQGVRHPQDKFSGSSMDTETTMIEKRRNQRRRDQSQDDSDEEYIGTYRRNKPRHQNGTSIVDRIRNDLRSKSKSKSPADPLYENDVPPSKQTSDVETIQPTEKIQTDLDSSILLETQETSTNHKPKDSRDKDDIIQPMAKIELKTSGISDLLEEHLVNGARPKTNRGEQHEKKARKSRNMKEIELIHVRQKIEREKSLIREISQVREVPAPLELMNQLVRISSANVSDELRKSCSNILARGEFFSGKDSSETEKEVLLKRLETLLKDEKLQVSRDLTARRQQLKETREQHRQQLDSLDSDHSRQLEELKNAQKKELNKLKLNLGNEIERLRDDIGKLEDDLHKVSTPSMLLRGLVKPDVDTRTETRDRVSNSPGLDTEFQCCICRRLLQPPGHIFQCLEGDLLCSDCETDCDVTRCPLCETRLSGNTSRNKALEKLALKYFAKL